MEIKVVKTISNKTFKDKKGKERNYENWNIVAVMENGKKLKIPFKPNYNYDNNVYKNLSLIAIVEDVK